VNYIEALDHLEVFGKWFAGESWRNWRVVEKAIFGLPLEETELPLFRDLTGRAEPPTKQASEVWVIAGRRTAKSRKSATIATFLSTIGAEVLGYRKNLAPGEVGTILVMAIDRRQANIVLDYAREMFRAIPMLSRMVVRDTHEGLELNNRMALSVLPNDFRAIRGRTLAACICDEVAFWRAETSRSPDIEVYRAAKPALATLPNSLLIGVSSAYRRAGLLWRKFKRHWGQPGDVLVVKAPTERLNPTINRQIIEEALEDDPEAARAEWMSEFRDDLSDYVRREVVEAAVVPGLFERGPVPGLKYFAFTDPSGGSSDSFTLAIAHKEGDAACLDLLRERKAPFSPEAVVDEFAQVLKSYRVSSVIGDRYAGEWPREQFRKRGITYTPSEKTKSEIYLEALPLLNARRLELLDDDRLISQICGLERRTARGGKDSVDHPPLGKDDLANATLGCAWMVLGGVKTATFSRSPLLGV
jgi:hypothetical protein